MIELELMGKNARRAARLMAAVPDSQRNLFLTGLASALKERAEEILVANRQDIEFGRRAGLDDALIDRLALNPSHIAAMTADLKTLAAMPDPIGKIIDERVAANGIHASRVRVPLGVIAVIYEARPNVTVDISALGLKSGNVVILRGGKETITTNLCLVNIIHSVLKACDLPADAVQFIDDADRALVTQLVKMDKFVDMLIPRGGNNLQQFCKQEATMPVMLGGIGICHLYVDASADPERALAVIQNAKVQRPTVCNALDTLLVNQEIAADFIPRVAASLYSDGVSLRLDPSSQPFLALDAEKGILPAQENDFDTEWLSLVLGIKVVPDLETAIEHIWQHSTFHSDGILTETNEHARQFVTQVDSAVVYVNASTRFSDGSQLGLGGEVAVSTQRLHARGPIGLEGLTTYKWVVHGDYTVRS
ncbi:MAG: glutamate-5-semialdehyde dehydrogenase [Chloroflexi bacterium 44-23]|nr:MAG: glutamate-5-semialdehyde dehydrogenase [Chloroflexi bacterium 44-23]